MRINKIFSVAAVLVAATSAVGVEAAEIATKFSNTGSIANTRHNLTQSPIYGEGYVNDMDGVRNNYGEVCVYCHTPHGGNTSVALPLWNRTIKKTTYQTYNELGTTTLTQTVSQPGAASLSCLSCHDGQTAIDSIINMPGSGKYDADSAIEQKDSFLNTWTNATGLKPTTHAKLTTNGSDIESKKSCLACHKPGSGAPDFTVFAISTDLRNDHPVGVTYPAPTGAVQDWNTPNGKFGSTRYFDRDGNGKMNSVDVRLYDTGGKVQVECASCHDPHGVPSNGPGSKFNPTFLRVNNTSSALCMTCHSK